MIKLLKNLKRREIIMAVICALLILGQIYFDLTLPDYMTDITKLINSPDPQTADIMSIGLKMLGLRAPCSPSSAATSRRGSPPASAIPCARRCSAT